MAQSLDIFESDRVFLEFISSILLGIGLVMLPLGLSCQFWEWGLCEVDLVPLFGGENRFRPELKSINLPLAMLILGFAARIPSRFGWTICILLLSILIAFFSFMAHYMYQRLDSVSLVEGGGLGLKTGAYTESLLLNGGFALLCITACCYLFFPGVRRIYWQGPAEPT